MTDDTVHRVAKCVAQVLALEASEISGDSCLMDDLGADSLDLVELMFLLEQEFAIKLSEKDMSLSGQLGLPDDEIHEDEVLTPKALELLRQRYPASAGILVEGVTRRALAQLVTVQEIARTVDKKLTADSGPMSA